MTDSPHPPFGVPWAAKGEERPSRFRTPLAWVVGHNGGVMMIQYGEVDRDGDCNTGWIQMFQWNIWVKVYAAAPVKQEQSEALWDARDEAG
jgi:hypothetical protein